MAHQSDPVKKVDLVPTGAPSASDRVALVIASFFGAGYLPVAPGTWGTLATIPLAYGLSSLGPLVYLVAMVALTGVAVWAAGGAMRVIGKHDPGIIVIDEVVGYLLTVAAVPRDAIHLGLGFVAFRFFDILKPGPIRAIDRGVMGGLGVVLDDLAAGIFAAATLLALDATGATAWLSALLGM